MSIASIRQRLEAHQTVRLNGLGETKNDVDHRIEQEWNWHVEEDLEALLKVVEALARCTEITPWEHASHEIYLCTVCGADIDTGHFEFCSWLELEQARSALEEAV